MAECARRPPRRRLWWPASTGVRALAPGIACLSQLGQTWAWLDKPWL
jgi:hypothetical protein